MSPIVFCKISLLYIFIFCNIITGKKLRPPGFDKPSECGRCKVLTDSFNYWMEKTSRGKYEGGDAAWEETKLKSYAWSEIRLVEVQEGLCSELKKHQDDCYMLAEEAEQVLEKWWFHEDPNSADLHTWLCIETLKYCCPANHFGDSCMQCPVDKNNNICGGHGKCDGDGTRKGNGTCICKMGYTGKFCEECSQNFYLSSDGSCEICHRACSGCSGAGPAACHSCKSGWQLDSDTCTDIDECLSSACQPNEYCINSESSFKCKPCDSSCKTCVGVGASNCTSCEPKSVLWTGMCINETQKNEFIRSTLLRLALYIGLLVITFIISRTSKHLASVIILIIAIYIYFSERALNMNMVNVLSNVIL